MKVTRKLFDKLSTPDKCDVLTQGFNEVSEMFDNLKAENKRLRDGLRDMSNYGRTYGGQKCADIAYEMLTGEKPDVHYCSDTTMKQLNDKDLK